MAKNGCYVQLHMHTSETSACGHATGAEMAKACKDAGYDVIVITDHFINANIGCSTMLPWREKVEYLFRGYYAAKEEGDKIGLTVLKAWETFTYGPEFLTYGLGEDFLLNNPDIADVPKGDYLTRVNAAGGFVIHAHPFRKAYYIPEFTPDPTTVEAFEVFNAAHKNPSYNAQALKMASRANLIMTAGSDAHRTDEIFGGAMWFPVEITDNASLIAAIRSRKGRIVEDMRKE